MSYSPDASAVAQQQSIRFTRFLSQRDLGLPIPVNYVTYPGVVLTAACFPYGRYEDVAAAKCFSNLLATGFRRLEADVYWDVSRGTWSLCPVELGSPDDEITSSTSVATTTSLLTATQLASNLLTARDVYVQATALDVNKRQGSDASTLPSTPTASSSINSEAVSTTATLGTSPGATVASSSNNSEIFQVGSYYCSLGTDLELLIYIMSEHMASTENNLNATTVTLTLNIHAAAAANESVGSSLQPDDDDLPRGSSLLSSVVASNASVYLYTPSSLLDQRSDINSSRGWFTVFQGSELDDAFFQVDNSGGRISTPDGWPSETIIELQQAKRMLVGFGTIDPQMSNYNFSGDVSTIFPQDYLESSRTVTTDSYGNVTSGCFFDPSVDSVARVNSSWAITSIGNGTAPVGSALETILLQAKHITYCGISPILNGTLNNVTADQSVLPYTAFIENTIWSWSAGQPINASSPDELNDYRCAALNSTSGLWQASDCSQSRYAACRINNQPYAWQISYADAPYERVDLACDQNTTFSVPRTALENTYLLSVWRQYQEDQDDDHGPLLWLDFNDLDMSACWVVGQNSSCPYDKSGTSDTREIVVPVVAAVIVFVLALLTVLVKCAGNRQNSKRRRRRGDDGWDYEGVPS